MENNNDWFLNLKIKIVSLEFLLQLFKEDMIIMLTMSECFLEGVSVNSLKKLQQILIGSNQDLEYLVKEIEEIEQGIFFSMIDLDDEFDCIHDIIDLALDYMDHIADYLFQFNQPTVSKKHEKEIYLNQEKNYLEQIKSNQQQLKQLRKERREFNFE